MSNDVQAGSDVLIQPFQFKTVGELYDMQAPDTEYLADGLLPVGGLSVLIGKPKAGKSTLVRQLAVAVAQGQPFLGRETQKGGVLYLALEEMDSVVKKHFSQLGLPGDAPVLVRTGAVNRKTAAKMLEASLVSIPDVGLVIIDPLFKFLSGVKDANEYMQVNDALEPMLMLARENGAHLLLVHHMKKVATESLGDAVLGSTAITGAVDTFIALDNDSQGVRKIASQQRCGEWIQPSQLNWHPDTQSFSLGQSVEEAQRATQHSTQHRIERDMLTYVQQHPQSTQQAILEAVTGKVATKKHVLRTLIDAKLLIQSGGGEKGDPYTYVSSAVPTERTVQ